MQLSPCLTLFRQRGNLDPCYVAQSWDTQRKHCNFVWCCRNYTLGPEKLGNFKSMTKKVMEMNKLIKVYRKVMDISSQFFCFASESYLRQDITLCERDNLYNYFIFV